MTELYYRKETLETIARRTLCEYNPCYLNGNPGAVPIETIIEKVFRLRIEYQYLTNNARELGRMIYNDGITTIYDMDIKDYSLFRVEAGTMMIDATLLSEESTGRLRFTLAHELAHYLIHKKIFCGTGTAAALYKNDTEEDAAEWQANRLAEAILMPKGQIKRCFYALRPVCQSSTEIVSKMAKVFEVSKQAMKIRLTEFGLL